MTALKSGLGKCPFLFSIQKTYPKSWAEMLARAEKYANAEEEYDSHPDSLEPAIQEKLDVLPEAPPAEVSTQAERRRSRTPPSRRRDRSPPRNRRNRSPFREPRNNAPPARRNAFTPLNAPRETILMQIRPQLPDPPVIRTRIDRRRDPEKYCQYHRDYGHDTEHCIQLREEIERFIQQGGLRHFIQGRGPPRQFQQRGNQRAQQRAPRPYQPPALPAPPAQAALPPAQGVAEPPAPPAGPPRVEIGVIDRGSTAGPAEPPAQRRRTEGDNLLFTEEDAEGVQFPHNDPLVVSLNIDDCLVHRVLIDNGSAVNVLYFPAFTKMGYTLDRLGRFDIPIQGFTGSAVLSKGVISLPVVVGIQPKQARIETDFLVIDLPSTYNAIFGRPGMHALKATTSSHYQMMKFPTPYGVGHLRGNQAVAKQCCAARLEAESQPEFPIGLDTRNDLMEEHAKPSEDLLEIPLRKANLHQTVKIGSQLDEVTKEKLTLLLQENADLFAWSAADMPGIDPEVMSHHLRIDPTLRPVKQKKRSFAPERQKAIAEEVDKLTDAGFIREAMYPDWLANVVLVKKANGKWRMCIDFTDLNKACPKDSYPLPRIDQLVDATSGHELLTFMDAFSGYNQIRMAPEDEEKTAFVTDRGLFCYRVMPFGLKNAGATYQRLVNKIFKDQIGRNMEVYVDDMLVKSQTVADHVTDLKEAFDTLR